MSEENQRAGAARERIGRAAFHLFRTIGFAKTSYTRIAEESGEGRPLVQYHFPKKDDLAVAFVERALQLIAGELDARKLADVDAGGRAVRMGQAYYAFLLHDDGMRAFTYGLLSNRQITSRIILVNLEQSLPLVAGDAENERLRAASMKATGGVYELLYDALGGTGEAGGADLDPDDLALQNTAAYEAFAEDAVYSEAYERLEGQLLDAATVEAIVAKLLDALG